MDVGVVVGVKYGCSYKQFLIINVVQMFFIRVIIRTLEFFRFICFIYTHTLENAFKLYIYLLILIDNNID